MNRLLMSKNGPALAGTIIGVIAALLVKFGNPGNMGVCVACFTRDVAGAWDFTVQVLSSTCAPSLPGLFWDLSYQHFCTVNIAQGEVLPR
jgi:hypothetical protein